MIAIAYHYFLDKFCSCENCDVKRHSNWHIEFSGEKVFIGYDVFYWMYLPTNPEGAFKSLITKLPSFKHSNRVIKLLNDYGIKYIEDIELKSIIQLKSIKKLGILGRNSLLQAIQLYRQKNPPYTKRWN